MIFALMKRLAGLLLGQPQGNGKIDADPISALTASYREELSLAHQIDAHAEKAPYPHVARRMRRMADEKRNAAGLLKEKLMSFHIGPEQPPWEVRTGRNHWERIRQDIEDQKALEDRLFRRALHLAETAPEISDLLGKIAAQDSSHREELMDLIARADPQAYQS